MTEPRKDGAGVLPERLRQLMSSFESATITAARTRTTLDIGQAQHLRVVLVAAILAEIAAAERRGGSKGISEALAIIREFSVTAGAFKAGNAQAVSILNRVESLLPPRAGTTEPKV